MAKLNSKEGRKILFKRIQSKFFGGEVFRIRGEYFGKRVSLLNIDASSTFKNFDIGSSWFGMQGEIRY